jgi:hypothetical protein
MEESKLNLQILSKYKTWLSLSSFIKFEMIKKYIILSIFFLFYLSLYYLSLYYFIFYSKYVKT